MNFFQGSYLRLRDVLSALIMLKRKEHPAVQERRGIGGTQTSMEDLNSYLNDHLAGSVGALELLDRLIDIYQEKPLERFFPGSAQRNRGGSGNSQEADRQPRRGRKHRAKSRGLGHGENFAGKDSTGRSGGGGDGTLSRAGRSRPRHHGKRALWRALAAASATVPQLRTLDYDELEKRAVEQHDRVEAKRLEIARGVFKSN